LAPFKLAFPPWLKGGKPVNLLTQGGNMKKKEEAVTNKTSNKGPIFSTGPGAVRASVFLNTTKQGVAFPSAVIQRRYLASDKTWKNSSSYGLRHIAELAGVVAEVYAWMQANYPKEAK